MGQERERWREGGEEKRYGEFSFVYECITYCFSTLECADRTLSNEITMCRRYYGGYLVGMEFELCYFRSMECADRTLSDEVVTCH